MHLAMVGEGFLAWKVILWIAELYLAAEKSERVFLEFGVDIMTFEVKIFGCVNPQGRAGVFYTILYFKVLI